MKLHPYKSFTDTAEHFKIFQAVKGFLTGVYTKEEFKSKLQNIDLSDLDSYKEHIKVLIKDALKEDEVVVETAEKIEDAVVEDIAIVEVEEIKATEDVTTPIVSRRRNFKANNGIEKVEE